MYYGTYSSHQDSILELNLYYLSHQKDLKSSHSFSSDLSSTTWCSCWCCCYRYCQLPKTINYLLTCWNSYLITGDKTNILSRIVIKLQLKSAISSICVSIAKPDTVILHSLTTYSYFILQLYFNITNHFPSPPRVIIIDLRP